MNNAQPQEGTGMFGFMLSFLAYIASYGDIEQKLRILALLVSICAGLCAINGWWRKRKQRRARRHTKYLPPIIH